MKRMILPVIKKFKKLLISVMLVSSMGCGFMSGLSSAHTSLEVTLNDYVEEYNYPDAVITTDVTNRKTIEKLQSLAAVSKTDARICGDTYLKSPKGRKLSVRVFSYNPGDSMKFHYWSKKQSSGMDEILLEYNFAEDNDIKAGDTVKVKVDKEYRKYFVAGIVTSPETLSVQPTDDSWGANTDFGYAYAPVSLLTKEYEQKYSELKDKIDDKQSEFDSEWEKTQSELSDAEQKLKDAKEQLEDAKKEYEVSSKESQEKLKKLDEKKEDLTARKSGLTSKREELLKSKRKTEQTLKKLIDNTGKLNEASLNVKKVNELLSQLDSISALLNDPQISHFLDMMDTHQNMDISYILQIRDNLENFIDTIEKYNFKHDVTEQVNTFSDKLTDYMDQIISDNAYFESGLAENDRNKAIDIMESYRLYNSRMSFEDNFQKTKSVIGSLADTIEENKLKKAVSYLPEIGGTETVKGLLSDISDMKSFIDKLAQYSGQTISTTDEVVNVYTSYIGNVDNKKEELKGQKRSILETLSEYEAAENDLSDIQSFIISRQNAANNSIAQINDSIKQTDKQLQQIEDELKKTDEEKKKIQSGIESDENKISDAEKKYSENESKYENVRTEAMTEFEDISKELEDAYKKLDDGEGYDMFCNQFLVYFKDGTDSDAALKKLEGILADEKIEVKSSYTYEKSAVRKRIDDNLKTIETLALLMPAVFFVIILIVVFLFMSLIIKQSRREIGILRALGFTKGNIRSLYCGVNFVASLFSILLGTAMGYALMRYMGVYFANFFPLSEFKYRPNWIAYILSVVLTVAAGQISTIISTGAISNIMPSEAMSRPAPETAEIPKLFEKLIFKASPMTKFSVTTLLRNKMRFVFSVICISASVMMIFSSLSFITSKNYMLNQLYEERIRYDCQIFFKEDPDEKYMKTLNELSFISDVQKLPFYQSEIKFNGKSEKSVINAVEKDTDLIGIYSSDNKKLSVPEDGIILEKHLAQKLGAVKGDTVKINGNDIKIEAISDQSISRFQYVSYETAKKLGKASLGSVICRINKNDEQRLMNFLTKDENYLYSVFTRLALKGNEKTFKTYDLAAWIIIGFAVIIGLIIVINTAQTNLLEKKRELCVLRTLGFQHSEVSRKWFVQSFLQFIFSCIVGLPSGIFIAKFALQNIGNDTREYVFANSFKEYLFTALLVFGYVVISHLIAMHSMKKWDLVESVKDKE